VHAGQGVARDPAALEAFGAPLTGRCDGSGFGYFSCFDSATAAARDTPA